MDPKHEILPPPDLVLQVLAVKLVNSIYGPFVHVGKNSWAYRFVKSPTDAPETIDLSGENGEFQKLMGATFADMEEDGGTFVGDKDGDMALVNIGGLERRPGEIALNLSKPMALDMLSSGLQVIGTFHTHGYFGDMANVSLPFSGADVANQINANLNFSVVQSNLGNQWLLLSTQQTPTAYIDPDTAGSQLYIQTKQIMVSTGVDQLNASMQVLKSWAQQYNMVLYQGKNGVLHRVH